MQQRQWSIRGALDRVPIYFRVIAANSAMAGVVIATLLLRQDEVIVVTVIVVTAGIVNALLVRAAFTMDRMRRQQRDVLAWTMAQTEKERDRIAVALHDDVAQRLAALVMRASTDRAVSTEAAAVMYDLCETARTLQPPGMQLLGLRGALDWYVRSLEQRTGLAVAHVVDCPQDALDPLTALGVFRLIEDILGTAADEGVEAAELDVQAHGDALAIRVRIAHDFTSAERFRLTERAALLGGRLHVSRDSSATLIQITLPVRGSHVGHDTRIAG